MKVDRRAHWPIVIFGIASFVILDLGNCASDALGQYYPNQNKFSDGRDQHGLGFGVSNSATTIYYDFNIPKRNKQIHIEYNRDNFEQSSILGDNRVTLNILALQTSFRHVYDSGWYFGLAGGWYYTNLGVVQSGWSDSEPQQELKFYEKGLLLGPQFGWQGNDFYYFSIGLNFSGRNKISGRYDINQVYDVSNHRKTIEDAWKRGKSSTGVFLGFGWYLRSSNEKPAPYSVSDSSNPDANDPKVFNKAKKCQSKGGVWVNNRCQVDIDE